MKIHFAESKYKINPEFKKKYVARLTEAYEQVAKLLPTLSRHINFFVQPREFDLIPEAQSTGNIYNSEFMELAFNPTLDDKGQTIILDSIKGSVFHELNHAARYNASIFYPRFIDNCILEGLATVFEREYAGTRPPYGDYPDNVTDWLQEIIDLGDDINWQHYSFNHPDGRRWITYKVGTYIINQAIQKSGKTVIELTVIDNNQILKLAQIDDK